MSTYLGDIVSTLTSAMSHTAEPSGHSQGPRRMVLCRVLGLKP